MRKKMLLGGLTLAVLAVFVMGGSFSWFTSKDAFAASAGVGSIELALDYEPEQTNGAGGFTLKNTGTLWVYVRVGYTFQYTKEGQPLMRDVSPIAFSNFSLERDGQAQPFMFTPLAHTAGGVRREKPFLIPLNKEGHYHLMQPGETLTVEYTLLGVEGDGLRITWVAEAIQGSEQALAAASAYGWDAGMA